MTVSASLICICAMFQFSVCPAAVAVMPGGAVKNPPKVMQAGNTVFRFRLAS